MFVQHAGKEYVCGTEVQVNQAPNRNVVSSSTQDFQNKYLTTSSFRSSNGGVNIADYHPVRQNIQNGSKTQLNQIMYNQNHQINQSNARHSINESNYLSDKNQTSSFCQIESNPDSSNYYSHLDQKLKNTIQKQLELSGSRKQESQNCSSSNRSNSQVLIDQKYQTQNMSRVPADYEKSRFSDRSLYSNQNITSSVRQIFNGFSVLTTMEKILSTLSNWQL